MDGSLIYMMGPSGAGKDTLLEIAKVSFVGLGAIKFAKRYITRSADVRGEDFSQISQPAFDYLDSKGHFFFSWRSHGFSYGIGRRVERFLQDSFMVVVNGSRAYLPKAIELCPSLTPVLITARAEVLAARLKKRGRESFEEQAERLHQPDYEYKLVRNLYTIDNSRELEIAADLFCSFLKNEWAKIVPRQRGSRPEQLSDQNIIVTDDPHRVRTNGSRIFMEISRFINKFRKRC
jgi:ribose 1,5-bisphosphokinase